MDSLLILICTTSALLSCTIIFLLLCCKRNHRRRAAPDRTLLITGFLQPHMVCKSIPCQHPYFRVISEYNSRTYDKLPGIEEVAEVSDIQLRNSHAEVLHQPEWHRELSLTSLPRRSSTADSASRKLSLNSVSSSRRSSESSGSSTPISPIYKTKPIQITQADIIQL